jgi:hypothetical protein
MAGWVYAWYSAGIAPRLYALLQLLAVDNDEIRRRQHQEPL